MRYWTEDEAREELPRLRVLIDAIAQAAAQASAAAPNGHRVPAQGDGTMDAETALAELAEKGIVLRDPMTGLLDFPAITESGVVYLLCWKRDEEDLGWWHFAEEGFAGRRPLPLPPDL